MKQPLSAAELGALAKRLSGIRELVKPINQKEVEGMKDKEILHYLVEHPNSVRRPIFDFGKTLVLGFRADAKKQLEAELG